MKDRILQFLESVKISPAEFADKIGVQRSSMSHILNGRNYPSAAFIQKMLQVYPLLNPRWLMIGDGAMNMESTGTNHSSAMSGLSDINAETNQSDIGSGIPHTRENPGETGSLLFPESETDTSEFENNVSGIPTTGGKESEVSNLPEPMITVGSGEQLKEERRISKPSSLPANDMNEKEIEQVLFFYKDKTFSIYRPS